MLPCQEEPKKFLQVGYIFIFISYYKIEFFLTKKKRGIKSIYIINERENKKDIHIDRHKKDQ